MPEDYTTRVILEEATLLQMTELYNAVPGVRQVSRLSDPTTARARLRLVLDRHECKLARTEGQPGVYRVVHRDAASVLRGPNSTMRRIRLLVEGNPKIGHSLDRFALYRDGMTMEDYIVAVQTRWPRFSRHRVLRDIYWDRDHGHIRLEE